MTGFDVAGRGSGRALGVGSEEGGALRTGSKLEGLACEATRRGRSLGAGGRGDATTGLAGAGETGTATTGGGDALAHCVAGWSTTWMVQPLITRVETSETKQKAAERMLVLR